MLFGDGVSIYHCFASGMVVAVTLAHWNFRQAQRIVISVAHLNKE